MPPSYVNTVQAHAYPVSTGNPLEPPTPWPGHVADMLPAWSRPWRLRWMVSQTLAKPMRFRNGSNGIGMSRGRANRRCPAPDNRTRGARKKRTSRIQKSRARGDLSISRAPSLRYALACLHFWRVSLRSRFFCEFAYSIGHKFKEPFALSFSHHSVRRPIAQGRYQALLRFPKPSRSSRFRNI